MNTIPQGLQDELDSRLSISKGLLKKLEDESFVYVDTKDTDLTVAFKLGVQSVINRVREYAY